jgi:hypothetical protein
MMTITIPRRTSTDTSRFASPGKIAGLWLTAATAGELTAVTMLPTYRIDAMFRSSLHRNVTAALKRLRGVNSLYKLDQSV